MIITLTGADFSGAYIKKVGSWMISRVLGSGASYDGPTSVAAGEKLEATVTLTNGYEVGSDGVTVTMGGVAQSGAYSQSGQVITFSIASVTGTVVIKVPTVNTTTGEEDEGTTIVWYDFPLTYSTLSIAKSTVGSSAMEDKGTRLSTGHTTDAQGILVKSGETITISGLRSGTNPLRADYVYATSAGPNPENNLTNSAWDAVVGTGSNYTSAQYFFLNSDGTNDTITVTNTYGADYYFFFAFCGINKDETITPVSQYTMKYKIESA